MSQQRLKEALAISNLNIAERYLYFRLPSQRMPGEGFEDYQIRMKIKRHLQKNKRPLIIGKGDNPGGMWDSVVNR